MVVVMADMVKGIINKSVLCAWNGRTHFSFYFKGRKSFNTESPCIMGAEFETKYDLFTSLLHRFIDDTNLRTSYGRRWRRG